MKSSICFAAFVSVTVMAFASAHEADVVITYESGRQTAARMALVEKGNGLYEWRLPRADLNIGACGAVRSVHVLPDFAKARYGEAGWLMAADGSRGFFAPRDVNANKLSGAAYQITPLYGMKTPRTTFVALATGMKYHAGISYVALTRAGMVKWFNAILDLYSDTFGGVASQRPIPIRVSS